MKRRVLVLVAALMSITAPLYAGNGDLVVNGNVGIGTSSPAAKLEVFGGHHNSLLKIHSSGDGGVNDAYLNLWASEPGVTYTGGGIGNNIWNSQVPPYFVRVNANRGGSYIRLLNDSIKMNLVNSVGTDINALNIDSIGSVGIGTTTPSERLDVNGNIRANGSLYNTSPSGYEQTYLQSWGLSGNGDVYIEPGQGKTLYLTDHWSTTGTLYVQFGNTVFASGNVGIGTTTPGAKLSVSGSAIGGAPFVGMQVFNTAPYFGGNGSGPARIEIGRSLLHGYIEAGSIIDGDSAAGYLAFGTRRPTNNIQEALRIDQEGNVGIGTTNPSNKLTVAGLGGTINNGGYITHLGGTDVNTDPYRYMLGFSHGGFIDGNVRAGVGMMVTPGGAGNLIFETGFGGAQVEKMRITGNGNVGIGTTNPDPAYKLTVEGSALARNGYWQGSDANLKKNVLPISDALNKVLMLEGKSYEWKENYYKVKETSDGPEVIKNKSPEGIHYGVIAQEIEKVLPGVVKEDADGIKAVAYAEIIPFLIEAIKEQQKQIDELKKR